MSTKNRIFPLFILTLLLMTSAAYAASPGWWFGGGVFTIYPKRPSTNLVYMGGTNPPIPDYYYVNSVGSVTNFTVNLFYQFCDPWSYRLGVIWLPGLTSQINGNVQNSDQIDYSYSFKMQNRVWFLDLQVDLLPARYVLSPYIDLGAGWARMFFDNYKEGTYPGSIPRTSPAWGNQSVNKVAYRYGIGINYEASVYSTPVAMSLALLYLNLGQGSSGYSAAYPAIAGSTLQSRVSGKTVEFTIRFNLW